MDQIEYDERVEKVMALPVAEVFLADADHPDPEVRQDAGMCQRLCNALEERGIVFMVDLLYTPWRDVKGIANFGNKTLQRILQGVHGAFADQQLWVDDQGRPWPRGGRMDRRRKR